MMDAVLKLVELLKHVVTWWFFVEPWETGIRVRCGSRLRVCTSGTHFKVPFMDAVYVHNMRRKVLNTRAQTVSSADGHTFSISLSVGYEIADALVLHNSAHDVEGVIEQEVAQMAGAFISSSRRECITVESVRAALSAIDLAKYGLGGVEIGICSMCAARTYRLIQDGIWNWRDDKYKTCTASKH